jgi:hypothetical protein
MLSILYVNFPEYYSLYARIYTLAFLSLQRTRTKDKETQKAILIQLVNLFKFIGNPVDLILHEIDPFEQLVSQLLVLTESDDFEIVSLVIEILNRISIGDNPQKEKIIEGIANYICRQAKKGNEERIIKALGAERLVELCSDKTIKLSLFKRTQANPDLYIALNMPVELFKIAELKQIFQSLVLANRSGFVELVEYFDYKLPYGLKDYVSFLMICSLYYDLPDIEMTEKWLKTIERVGISKSYISDLRDSLRGIYYAQGGEYKRKLEEFGQRNKNVIGGSPKEFLRRV